ncbi:single-stranded DNA-binding protein [Sharpea azabuensis]|uniref:single-stranded DNA-binding protein n=1 Tax=Sharpea azabuensis TaxID=322505 RepID=UPI002E80F346|nr:single-stranded DNA-binding protein [Sharpea azabuensis]MEE3307864.1 single-stranded DNA-binding protein [Sharpea azabuensis]
MNKVILIGRLTKEPEIRATAEGLYITRFTIAVDRRSKDKETDFISCVAFGKTAETIEKYCRKGMKIAIEGRIQTGSYTNKDGNKVYTTDVNVNEIEFVERKTEERPSAPEDFIQIPEGSESELPFK